METDGKTNNILIDDTLIHKFGGKDVFLQKIKQTANVTTVKFST